MSRRSNRVMDGLIPGYGKIRKRGCSSSSSSSSKVHNYRFKRTILVGKTRVGCGSRSSTPAPSWRMTPSSKSKLGGGGGGGGAVETPNYDGGRSRPVSARKLAATLWEMNEMPSPETTTTTRVKERRNRPFPSNASLPHHLSDPSHSPVSERRDRSGTGSHRRRMCGGLEDNNVAVFDSLSNSSLMEIETKSRAPNVDPRLKDVSNALTTSKELLKIIHRMWAHDHLPSSTMSLISALHTELERARLHVNNLIRDHNPSDVSQVLKASWKAKERQAVEAAVESIAAELETEKKLRRRFENLNKKLGRELAETKASLNELAVDVGEELKRESVKAQKEVEREREMLRVADKLREERVQMKLAEAKHEFEEKNALVDMLRGQLESFLGGKKKKTRNLRPLDYNEQDSEDSELHSIELNMDNQNKSFKWANHSKQDAKTSRKSTSSIQRSVSDAATEWGMQENFLERVRQTPRRSHGDDMQRYKSIKGLRDRILSDSVVVPAGQCSGSKSTVSEAKGGRRWRK